MTKARTRSVLLLVPLLIVLVFEWQWGMDAEAADKVFHKNVSPAEAAGLIREHQTSPDFVVLDVRTPEEYQDEHIRGAVLLDFKSDAFREKLDTMDRGKTYLVYCRTERRSGSAVSLMKEMRFGKIFHLSGGITAWKKMGFLTTSR